MLAQRRSSINLSVTDPYFLDRNLVAGFDVFLIQTDYLGTEPYDERRGGFALRLGYDFNEHLRQVWSYTLVDRDVYNISSTASVFILNQAGTTLLSQVSQVITLDYRDSRVDPHSGFVVEVGTDYAGLGGNVDYVRGSLNGAYYIPLDRFTGNSDWGIKLAAGAGYLWNWAASRSKSSTASSWAATICAASKPAAPDRMMRSPAIRWAGGSSGPARSNCVSHCRSRPTSGCRDARSSMSAG